MLEVFSRTGPPTLGGRHFGPIAMLTKEPEMLQPDAFCEHTMQQNETVAGALPRTPLGELTSLPQTP